MRLNSLLVTRDPDVEHAVADVFDGVVYRQNQGPAPEHRQGEVEPEMSRLQMHDVGVEVIDLPHQVGNHPDLLRALTQSWLRKRPQLDRLAQEMSVGFGFLFRKKQTNRRIGANAARQSRTVLAEIKGDEGNLLASPLRDEVAPKSTVPNRSKTVPLATVPLRPVPKGTGGGRG